MSTNGRGPRHPTGFLTRTRTQYLPSLRYPTLVFNAYITGMSVSLLFRHFHLICLSIWKCNPDMIKFLYCPVSRGQSHREIKTPENISKFSFVLHKTCRAEYVGVSVSYTENTFKILSFYTALISHPKAATSLPCLKYFSSATLNSQTRTVPSTRFLDLVSLCTLFHSIPIFLF